MARLFGTDGVRGIANRDLTCELAFKLGQAAAYVLASHVHRPTILVGRDTRISGEMLESALVAGICSMGARSEGAAIAMMVTKCGFVVANLPQPLFFSFYMWNVILIIPKEN